MSEAKKYDRSYWNNRRICPSIGGMPLAEKRRRFLFHCTALIIFEGNV